MCSIANLQQGLLSSVHISVYKYSTSLSCVTVLQTVVGLVVYMCQYSVPYLANTNSKVGLIALR